MTNEQTASGRHISLLTRKTLALILAGGRGSRLGRLVDWRVKPAVPFGGKFRIIDFPLSNCINSGIRKIGVLTQYKSHSLIRHIQKGWNFLRGESEEFVEILPAQQRMDNISWYAGTADAVYQNLDIIRSHQPDYVLILAGDHIYKMDYGTMIAYHESKQADMTVGCVKVSLEMAKSFGVMSTDAEGRIVRFNEKPKQPEPMPNDSDNALASMGIYLFNRDFLYEQLVADAYRPESSHDFGKDVIPNIINKYRVFAFPFQGVNSQQKSYWRDVGTLDAFWEANMELVAVQPELDMYDKEWRIWTYQEQLPPAKFVFNEEGRCGMAVDSMVSGGCIISGAKISRSLLFSNVRVHSYSVIADSVILPDVDIGRNCRIRRCVIDKGCRVPEGMEIGYNLEEDKRRGFEVSKQGVVLVVPEMLGQHLHHTV